jgi:hypothetical protein
MLRIIEVSTKEHLTTERAKEVSTNDYLYILKYNNCFLLIDNGIEHYMNAIMKVTQPEYDVLPEKNNDLLYMVSNTVDSVVHYSIYFNGTKIDSDSSAHSNITVLNKLSESAEGKLLYNGQEISSAAPILSHDSPIGTIIAYMGGTTPPDSYLICDGRDVLQTDYPYLASHIYARYGSYNYFDTDASCNVSTHFTLPNLVGKFLKGGASAGTYQEAGLPNITADWKSEPSSSAHGAVWVTSESGTAEAVSAGGSSDNRVWLDASRSSAIYGKSTTVTPENISVLYCIKYENTYATVAQYQGFKIKTLFDGNANAVGTYTLSDSIENYDYIVVYHDLSVSGIPNYMGTTITIPAGTVAYNRYCQFMYSASTTAAIRRMLYGFTNATTLSIQDITKDAALSSIQVTKVIGYKS